MIISDRHRFIFIHIPKCGGTTVRTALMPYDDHRAEFYDKGRSTHETLGEVDYHHLPLNVLRTHFPHAYELLKTYPSYALTRDPMERFCSGVVYRFYQIKNKPKNSLTFDTFRNETSKIIKIIDKEKNKNTLPINYIHFTRQANYISDQGEVLLSTIYKLDNIKEFLKEISEITCKNIEYYNENQSFYYKNRIASTIDPLAQRAVKKIVPRRIWKPVFSRLKISFMRRGIIDRENTSYFQEALTESQRAYLLDYYKEDAILYAAAR